MKPVTRAEILPNAEFVELRRKREREVIAAKEARRLAVGPNMTLLFENRESVWWQVQEMCRVEHITAEAGIAHELETYNHLLPGPSELSATLLVEYPEPAVRDEMLVRLHGLHEHLWLDVSGERSLARFDEEQWNERRISSVQFVRFSLSPAALRAFLQFSEPAAVLVDHAAYVARAPIGGILRGALCEDLSST